MSTTQNPKGEPPEDGPEPLTQDLVPLGALTLEAPEALTPEDLEARSNVGFALDLEPFLPGPAVGSERVLLETDPDAARRLGVAERSAFAPPIPPTTRTPPMELEPPLPPQADLPPLELSAAEHAHVDVEPVLEPETPFAPVAATPPWTRPTSVPPPAVPSWTERAEHSAPPVRSSQEPLHPVEGGRSYPLAWAWAGLGEAPRLGQRMQQRAATVRHDSASAEDMLELAAVGTDEHGVTEMLLIFKEDVLRGLTCKLRMEPTGLTARFVAPDETVRRYVESTAQDLVARMQKRGLRVGGWTVEVSA